ncbi:hypothetical protein PR202_ga28091 [Eleusine coracana subsp. coracana]|uniref:Uncharacterized protein n=1 Tax=Eleusine coracana subsp. coracana TaxID=191504 RepID=A0AAV5DIX5_ELECO|nr:hypothetical protein PR202_ga28091 [Eleusine coracana subsp. coracana]
MLAFVAIDSWAPLAFISLSAAFPFFHTRTPSLVPLLPPDSSALRSNLMPRIQKRKKKSNAQPASPPLAAATSLRPACFSSPGRRRCLQLCPRPPPPSPAAPLRTVGRLQHHPGRPRELFRPRPLPRAAPLPTAVASCSDLGRRRERLRASALGRRRLLLLPRRRRCLPAIAAREVEPWCFSWRRC